MKGLAHSFVQLEIDIEGWRSSGWEVLARQTAQALSALVPELANPRLHVSILFTSDEEVQSLNREWRGRDKPTNVLSFPMLDHETLHSLSTEGPPEMLGDIAMAHETCAREAAEKDISLEDHAAHLIIHGLLHLAGHDHEISDDDAQTMETLEIKALAQMGIADPYGDLEDIGEN